MTAYAGFLSSWYPYCDLKVVTVSYFFGIFLFFKGKTWQMFPQNPSPPRAVEHPPLHPTMQLTSLVICYTYRQTGSLHSKGNAQ